MTLTEMKRHGETLAENKRIENYVIKQILLPEMAPLQLPKALFSPVEDLDLLMDRLTTQRQKPVEFW